MSPLTRVCTRAIQTTMNYLGVHQNLVEAVNDRLGLAE